MVGLSILRIGQKAQNMHKVPAHHYLSYRYGRNKNKHLAVLLRIGLGLVRENSNYFSTPDDVSWVMDKNVATMKTLT